MGKSAPQPTPVNDVANAQNGSNLFTSQANMAMNAGGSVNPYGSQSSAITGYQTITDPSTGATYQVPTYTQTTTLNGDLAQPFNPDTSQIEGYLSDLGRQRLDPQFAQSQATLETQLANQGIQRGSDAWNSALSQLGQQKNDAYNQLYLTGNQQAYGQLLGNHQTQMNDFLSMLGGPQAGQMPGVNMMGLYGNNDAMAQQQWQQQQQMYGSMLGSAGLMFM